MHRHTQTPTHVDTQTQRHTQTHIDIDRHVSEKCHTFVFWSVWCHTFEWAMSRIWVSCVTHLSESCHALKCVSRVHFCGSLGITASRFTVYRSHNELRLNKSDSATLGGRVTCTLLWTNRNYWVAIPCVSERSFYVWARHLENNVIHGIVNVTRSPTITESHLHQGNTQHAPI